MKSYTDIEQGKKLAEILPIESADMCYGIDDATLTYTNLPWLIPYYKYTPKEFYIPCWSLAALLDIIPKEVKIKGQKYAPCLFPITDSNWLYKLWYNSNEIIESPISVWCDNPVDAGYEMILKLHKLNLL